MTWRPWRQSQPLPSNDEMVSQNGDIVIAVMGVTGAGKSSFIKSVTGREDIQVGHGLYSETSKVQAYSFSHRSTKYVLADTPGFDDSSMSNEEVTTTVLQWLESSYRGGTRLNGIIYIHDIRKSRVQGSVYQNMRLFSQLCGDGALRNVILATSFWDQVTESVGAKREHELKTSKDFWADMVAKGSEVVRIEANRSSKLELLEQIAAKNKVDLPVQREMVEEKKKAEETTVGQNAISRSSEIREFEETVEREKEIEREKLRERLEEGQKAHEEDMRQLRIERERSQRQARQEQLRAEEQHQRNLQADRRQMQQERRGIEDSLRQLHQGRGIENSPRQQYHKRGREDFRPQQQGKLLLHGGLYMLTAVWLLLATSLTGNVIGDSSNGTPASINYAMFAIVWAWLALLTGMASLAPRSISLIVVLFLDISATVFIFCTAVDFAAELGINSCFDNAYLVSTNIIVGSSNLTKRCQELQASDAFLWFIFTCFVIIAALDIARATRRGTFSSEAD